MNRGRKIGRNYQDCILASLGRVARSYECHGIGKIAYLSRHYFGIYYRYHRRRLLAELYIPMDISYGYRGEN